MKEFQVKVGGFYVNERKGLIREVTHIDDDGNAHWQSYDLTTGDSTGDFLKCAAGRILQWADRAATPDEAARLKQSEISTRRELWLLEGFYGVLRVVPDEELFAEVKRRGRKVI